ncbi:MAG: hypothetical protein WC557_07735 [Ignavibacteriaceae bacterium]
MKISANAIGNYSPLYAAKSPLTPEGGIKKFPLLPKGESKSPSPIAIGEGLGMGFNPELTTVEKEFFAALYPQEQSQIMDYHFYQKNGQMSGVKIGSMFDKRG